MTSIEDIIVERPAPETLADLAEPFFDISVETGTVRRTDKFELLSSKEKILCALLALESVDVSTNALDVGNAVGATGDGMRDDLEWNFYAHLRSLEQDGTVVREDGGEYRVSYQALDRSDSTKDIF